VVAESHLGGLGRHEKGLLEAFEEVFGSPGPGSESAAGRLPLITHAPGRVNLIGEHTDYNDGFVLPAAIDRHVSLASAPSHDGLFHLHSLDHGDTVVRSLDPPHRTGHWSDYVIAVAAALGEAGHTAPAMTAVLTGNVPQGGGLSSSAALEVCTALALCLHAGITMEGPALAALCQRAENEFVGVRCGIMDQFASALARAECALFLDCRDLSFEHVPFLSRDVVIAVIDSGVQRSLSDAGYNARRRECEQGVREIGRLLGEIESLRDVTPDQLASVAGSLPEPVASRCRHVVEENGRVLEAVGLLKACDFIGFGKLMIRSHESLRTQFEVSCPELDLLVEIACSLPGVLGSRMTGAGFGGCTVSLVEADHFEGFASAVRERYSSATGIDPAVYRLRPAAGALSLIDD